ncbi:Hypothetical protein CpOVI03_02116 [Corynebacterium pseudotuberculosis]|nr:Hypothetical protein CpOVI03_02116 [Corynebacterium pseudotuberculosis]
MLSISLARTMRAVFLFGYLPGHEPAINHIPIAQRKSHVLLLYQRLFLTTGKRAAVYRISRANQHHTEA